MHSFIIVRMWCHKLSERFLVVLVGVFFFVAFNSFSCTLRTPWSPQKYSLCAVAIRPRRSECTSDGVAFTLCLQLGRALQCSRIAFTYWVHSHSPWLSPGILWPCHEDSHTRPRCRHCGYSRVDPGLHSHHLADSTSCSHLGAAQSKGIAAFDSWIQSVFKSGQLCIDEGLSM